MQLTRRSFLKAMAAAAAVAIVPIHFTAKAVRHPKLTYQELLRRKRQEKMAHLADRFEDAMWAPPLYVGGRDKLYKVEGDHVEAV